MTRFDADGVADLLYAASDDAPPSRVSLDGVLTHGRRRRRRRAVAVPLFAAAAIAALAAGGMVAANLRPTGLEPPPGATTPAPTSLVAPFEFPVDRQLFALGERPGRLLDEVRLGRTVQELHYGQPDVKVTVFAAGADGPRQVLTDFLEHRDAPSVHGLPATFLYARTSVTGIEFQWAPGAWALIQRAGADVDEEQLVELAGDLRTDLDEPMLFCFTVSPPQSLHIDWAGQISDSGKVKSSELWLGLGDGTVPAPYTTAFRVTVSVGDLDLAVTPNRTIGEYQAFVNDDPTGYYVALFDDHGYSVQVTVAGDNFQELFSAQQANDLALSVRPLGSLTDRSQWTDDPIR